MKRGERQLWRDVAATAQKVAESENYAEEYFYSLTFRDAFDALLDFGAKTESVPSGVGTTPPAPEPGSSAT